jgi:hypothetical protein
MRPSAVNSFRLSTVLFSWYVVTYVLLPIPAVRPGLDESWRAFLTWTAGHNLQFGTEVIFTYGPWGFLLDPRGTSSAYPWQVLGRFVLAVGASVGIAYLAISWIRSAIPLWMWAAAIVLLAEPSHLMPVLLFLVTMPAAGELRVNRPVMLLVAFATGLAACTKFTCFVLVATVVPLLLLRRRLAIVAATCVGSFLLFWFAARQGVSNLPAFVSHSLELAGGYSSAMTFGYPSIELLPAFLVCALPLVQVARWITPRLNLETLARFGWLALCELQIFRLGLIRNDSEHHYQSFLVVGLPIALLMMALPSDTSWARPPWWKPVYGVLLAGGLAVSLLSSLSTVRQKAALFLESFRQYPVYARHLASSRASKPPLAAEDATVDVFPTELSYAIRKGLPLHNRPVIQAYSAYTRNLSATNAAFLDGRDAPRKIYLRVDSIDGRYPTLDDSLAWRSLLTRYRPSSVADEYIVFTQRERPVDYESRLILDREIHTDEFLDIPDAPGRLIWAELYVQRMVAGRLADLLFRSERMVLRVETAQRSQDFGLLPGTAAAGFLLSPSVNTQAAILEIFQAGSGGFYAENVRRIMIHRGRVASLEFGRNLKVRLYALALKASPQEVPGQLLMDLGRTLRTERPVGSVGFSPALTVGGGEVRLIVGSPSSGWIPQPAAKSVRVRYGIDGTQPDCSGEVAFRILFESGAGQERRLLWQTVHPFEAGRAWSAESTIDLPASGGQPILYFETNPLEASCGGVGAYWSDLRIAH